MRKFFFLSFMLILSVSFAKKWDAIYIGKLIATGEIDKVIQYYQDQYYSTNRDPQDAFRIAELYVKKKDYETAMLWYNKESQLIYTSRTNLYNYAYTNQLMGNYQKALDAYLMYAAQTGDVSKVMGLANQCEMVLKASSQTANYKLENYTYNTKGDEKSIAVLRTNPIYITTKADDKNTTNDIKQIVRSFDNFAKPQTAYKSGVGKLVITGLSYTQDGNFVVFSAYDPATVKLNQPHDQLYFAENLGGNFLNVQPFPHNIPNATLKNPSYNANGTTLYFSSNQVGGSGGFDIWQSKMENGKWSKPINLGKLLNTTSDEISPFIVQNKTENELYFSSNRDGGFGGFDIFKATAVSGVWEGVEMQPAPVNSAGDDIGIIYDDAIKTGYVVSDRIGGNGGFDIYRFIPFNLKLIAHAYDSLTEQSMSYAMVQVLENGNKIYEGVTDNNGRATFNVDKNKTFTVKFSNDNYRTSSIKVNTNGKLSGDSVIAENYLVQDAKFAIKNNSVNAISLDNFIVFTGKVIDASTNKPAKVKMRMVNYATQKLRELEVDSSGKFEIRLLLNNNYKIIFETPQFKITDELTTLGLERNNVKVKDYLLTGNKFKLTENRVYKENNVPSNILLNNKIEAPIAVTNITTTSTTSSVSKSTSIVALKDSVKTIAVKEEKKQENILATTKTTVAEISKETPKVEEEAQLAANMINTQKIEKTNDTPKSKKIDKKVEQVILEDIKVDTPENEIAVPVITTIPEEKPTPNIVVAFAEVQPKLDTVITQKVQPTIEPTPTIKETSVPVVNKPIAANKPTPTEIISTSKNVNFKAPVTPPAPKNNKIELPEVYYKVQIASLDEKNAKFPEFEQFGTIEEVNAYNKYIYRVGNFDNLEKAKDVLSVVRSQGYFVAFILQYNKEKITGIIN